MNRRGHSISRPVLLFILDKILSHEVNVLLIELSLRSYSASDKGCQYAFKSRATKKRFYRAEFSINKTHSDQYHINFRMLN